MQQLKILFQICMIVTHRNGQNIRSFLCIGYSYQKSLTRVKINLLASTKFFIYLPTQNTHV